MPTLLPMFLNTFINKHPKINLKIQELNTDSIITQLKEGKIDAGIAATPLKYDNIEERPLYYEPFVGYIPEQHRLNMVEQLSQEDLHDENILVLEEGHCFRNQALSFCSLVANALGSNIFDICFALGFPLFAFTLFNGPIIMTPETVANVAELQASLVILTIIAFLIYYFNNGLKQIHAFLLLSLYILFIAFIFAKAYEYEWAIQLGQTIASWIPSAL